MRTAGIILTILMLTAVGVAGSSSTPRPLAADKHKSSVSIKGMAFDPNRVDVKVGDTVEWTNEDDRDHTVVAKDGSFKSDKLGRGDTFAFKFKKAGKFPYACSYHPRMKGVVVVGE
jgi:plastocyanin